MQRVQEELDVLCGDAGGLHLPKAEREALTRNYDTMLDEDLVRCESEAERLREWVAKMTKLGTPAHDRMPAICCTAACGIRASCRAAARRARDSAVILI